MRILLMIGVVFMVACLGFVAFGRMRPNFITSAQQRSAESSSEVRTNIQKLSSASAVDRAEAACRLGKLHAVEAIPSLVTLLADDTKIQQPVCGEKQSWKSDLSNERTVGEIAAATLSQLAPDSIEPLIKALKGG